MNIKQLKIKVLYYEPIRESQVTGLMYFNRLVYDTATKQFYKVVTL